MTPSWVWFEAGEGNVACYFVCLNWTERIPCINSMGSLIPRYNIQYCCIQHRYRCLYWSLALENVLENVGLSGGSFRFNKYRTCTWSYQLIGWYGLIKGYNCEWSACNMQKESLEDEDAEGVMKSFTNFLNLEVKEGYDRTIILRLQSYWCSWNCRMNRLAVKRNVMGQLLTFFLFFVISLAWLLQFGG